MGTSQTPTLVRVAAAQFATTQDLDENLATCLRMLDEAAASGAALIVFPEFTNHISVYRDAEHCREVAVELGGPWLGSIRERVDRHRVHLVITVTARRPPGDGDASDDAGPVTVTNVLIGPDGQVVATADKTTLMGNERAFLTGGTGPSPVVDTSLGPIGMYSCMDGVTFETPRGLAVQGARLLTNSLNSFALDEAALHIPVRAIENGVWVVAANKVGPLLPPDQVSQFSAALGIPPDALNGAGESQIVAPDGRVVARAPRTGEAVVVADIDLAEATAAPLAGRRPAYYRALAAPETATPRADVPDVVPAAAIGDAAAWPRALAATPELAVLAPGVEVAGPIPPGMHVVGADGSVSTSAGVVMRQPELHAYGDRAAARRGGTGVSTTPTESAGDEIATDGPVRVLSTPFGDLAVITGDDWRYPEVFRLAAIQGAHIVAVSWRPEQPADWHLAIVERAAENRLCLLAAAPAGAPGTLALNPPADSLWVPQRSAPYDGTINTPDRTGATTDGLLTADLLPRRALDREISRNTDLVGGRSWQASSVLATQHPV